MQYLKTKALILLSLLTLSSVSVSQAQLDTDLNMAAKSRDYLKTRRLIDVGFDVNEPGENGLRPLHWAALNKDWEITLLLLLAEAQTDVEDLGGMTPYDIALTGENNEIMLLLESATTLSGFSRFGMSPAHVAVENYHFEHAKALYRRGESFSTGNSAGRSAWETLVNHFPYHSSPRVREQAHSVVRFILDYQVNLRDDMDGGVEWAESSREFNN